MQTVGIGVIGLGHWGPNHVRVFGQTPGARVVAAADPSHERRQHVSALYRDVELAAAAADVFARRDVDAVVIARPARTHCELASAALAPGKHVLLEKPTCTSMSEARWLLDAARRRSRAHARPRVRLQQRQKVRTITLVGSQRMVVGNDGSDDGYRRIHPRVGRLTEDSWANASRSRQTARRRRAIWHGRKAAVPA